MTLNQIKILSQESIFKYCKLLVKMKKVLIFLILAIFFIFSPFIVKAEKEFSTDIGVTYEVKDNGLTKVTSKIKLTNIYDNLYATSYSMVLDSINPQNYKAFDSKGPIKLNFLKDGSKVILEVVFNDQVVGKGQSRIFYIYYEEEDYVKKTGEVWEVSIPKISNSSSFFNYQISLLIPRSFGQEAYITPSPLKKEVSDQFLKYHYGQNEISHSGITAGFGEFQIFAFDLKYHLENPLNKSVQTSITFPPDTAFQKMYYESISPKPFEMKIDIDGNWIGTYQLKARERLDIQAIGKVQIFSGNRPFIKSSQEQLNSSLLATQYWQSDDEKIKALALSLKTPRNIYNYVANKLKYDYSRVKPNVERLGAVKALENPNSAICMEYTDLFVAIARAAGIPAREVNGYAYTENPEIQPLSLVNDVLHAWPEYYDQEKAAWIPVDPTWSSTTNGIDFFDKMDLRHFSFVIHGKEDNKPYAAGSYKLGTNPEKDVFVTFSSLPTYENNNINIKALINNWLPFTANKLNITFINSSPYAYYDLRPSIYFDDVYVNSNLEIDYLLPFSQEKRFFDIPFSFLGSKTPHLIKISLLDNELVINSNKNQVIVYNLLLIFLLSLVVIIIFVKKNKWTFWTLKK